jgi:hypothetical protein
MGAPRPVSRLASLHLSEPHSPRDSVVKRAVPALVPAVTERQQHAGRRSGVNIRGASRRSGGAGGAGAWTPDGRGAGGAGARTRMAGVDISADGSGQPAGPRLVCVHPRGS